MLSDRLSIVYFDEVSNAGDLCSPEIISTILNRATVKCVDRLSPHMLGVGSIMSMANSQSYIWGSGVIDPNIGFGEPDFTKIFALRGKLTLSLLKKSFPALSQVVLGDPAILLADLLNIRKSSSPSYRMGVIPHYIDEDVASIKILSQQDGVKLIRVGQELPDFLTQIADCENIASTSLHGLVFAESMDIPNIWIRASDNIVGGNFKYMDWFSLAKRPQISPFYINRESKLNHLIPKCDMHGIEICKQSLVEELLKINELI